MLLFEELVVEKSKGKLTLMETKKSANKD